MAAQRALVDFGSRRGTWKRKCLENAVLGLCRGKLWGKLQQRFEREGGNDSGAGPSGTEREMRNMELVKKALRDEGRCVTVIGASSKRAYLRGEELGRWRWGAVEGETLGEVVWAQEEKHV